MLPLPTYHLRHFRKAGRADCQPQGCRREAGGLPDLQDTMPKSGHLIYFWLHFREAGRPVRQKQRQSRETASIIYNTSGRRLAHVAKETTVFVQTGASPQASSVLRPRVSASQGKHMCTGHFCKPDRPVRKTHLESCHCSLLVCSTPGRRITRFARANTKVVTPDFRQVRSRRSQLAERRGRLGFARASDRWSRGGYVSNIRTLSRLGRRGPWTRVDQHISLLRPE